MKRLYKISLLLLMISITFFCKMNIVRADNSIYCYYMLPFTGVKPSEDRYMLPNDDIKCFDETRDSNAMNCYVEAKATPNISIKKTKNGYYESSNFFNSYKRNKYLDNKNYVGYKGSIDPEISSTEALEVSYFMFGATPEIKATDPNLICKDTNVHYCEEDERLKSIDVPTNESALYVKANAKTCPQFIVVNKAGPNIKNYLTTTIIGNNPTLKYNYILYSTGNSESYFRDKLNNFNGVNISNRGDYRFYVSSDDFYNYNNLVLPLYDAAKGDTNSNYDEEANTALINSNLKIFRETVIKSWINIMNKQINNMKSNCGDKEWENYINLNNYKNYISEGTKSKAFVSYGRSEYDSGNLKEPDKNIGQKCWDARAEFFGVYRTFRVFWYSIGFPTNGDDSFITDKKNDGTIEGNNKYIRAFAYDDENINSNNVVYNYPTLKLLFKKVRYGSDTSFEDADKDVNSDLMNSKMGSGKKYESADYVNEILYKDRCSYKCFGVTSEENFEKNEKKFYQDKYNYCKTYNTSYKDCVSDMKECGGGLYSSYEEKCKNNTGQGYDMCMKTYDTDTSMEIGSKFRSCMDGKISDFSSSYDSMKSTAETAKESAKDEFTKSATYSFESAGLLRFDLAFKKYEPNCRDVKFLTIIWNIMIVLAPFLLIIYSSFDYFKVVMAGNEEKMKVSRKKVPRRLIALVLLLVFPVILRAFVTKFGTNGANNITYVRCVVTNDQGEKEETKNEDEEKDKNTDENSKK